MVSTRSRTRQQQLESTTPAEDPVQLPVQVKKPAPAAKPVAKRQRLQPDASKGVKGQAKATQKPVKGKGSKPNAPSSAQDRLHSLPPEILSMVLNNIHDIKTIHALGRTCKDFHARMTPRLYRRIAVAAMFHAHIPKLIRKTEPLLSIGQKKQLKKEGKYKGQQERYPTGLDEKKIPSCASYVQQLVIGVADPGRKHKYIVERYMEEVLKNLVNLEALETRVLTESIAKSIASLNHLKALSLFLGNEDKVETDALAKVKNLKHLCLSDVRWSYSDRKHLQSIIVNSASTLESLDVHVSSLYPNSYLLVNWENCAALKELKSLSLKCYSVERGTVEAMKKAIDFTKLTSLDVGSFYEEEDELFQSLTASAKRLSSQGKRLSLRHLSLEMDEREGRDAQGKFEAKCRFISSFDSLETLKFDRYGEYSADDGGPNPGFHDEMLQAILKHRGLKSLKIYIGGVSSGRSVRRLAPQTVREIVNGLPELREFQFVPDTDKIDEMAQALACGDNLSSIDFCTWFMQMQQEDTLAMISKVTKAFLDRQGPSESSELDSGRPYVWEDRCNLKKLTASRGSWEFASKFHGKGEKGTGKAEKIVSDDGGREVWFRDISRVNPFRIHVGYDPDFEWLYKIGYE